MKGPRKVPSPEEVLSRLDGIFTLPGAMDLTTPFITLVGVVLSARTRDEQVLIAMPELVTKFPTPEKMAKAEVEEIRKCIKSIGMNGQKAKNLKGLATRIQEEYGGEVPDTMEELITLPGVGRKTASVVLSVVFDTPAIAVDTHVYRLARRLKWSRGKRVEKVEQDLLKKIPKNLHNIVNRVFVKLGRYICLPQKPRCAACPLQDICPYTQKNMELPKNTEELEGVWKEKERIIQELRKEVIDAHKNAL